MKIKNFARFRGLCFKVILTILAFYLLFRGLDMSRVAELLQQQNHLLLLAAITMLAIQIAFGGLRWHLILRALNEAGSPIMPLREASRLFYITAFFNGCLPGGAMGGDVMRVWLAKSERIPLPLAIHSVIIDRIITLGALLLMITLALPWIGALAGFNGWPPVALIVVACIAGLLFLRVAGRLLARFQSWPPVRWLLYFIGSLRLLLSHPTASFVSLLYACIAHGCFCIAAYALAHSLGIDLSLVDSFILLPMVMFAMVLPLSIGGWGLREAGMVGALGLIGVPKDVALTLSLQLGLLTVLISLPGGLLWLGRRNHISQVAGSMSLLREQ